MSNLNRSCDLTSNYVNVIDDIKCTKENVTVNKPRTAKGVASDIINEILENAMDAATKSSLTNISEGENLCKLKTLSDDTRFLSDINNMANNANFQNEQQNLNIREMVEALHINNAPATNTEEPLRLDMEMKRFLNEIMSPPYEIINSENAPRKDGVGDQPSTIEETNDNKQEIDHTRIVEKKSRVTDLVMNSKQVLTELFLNEEEKKKQEDWEEAKEDVIQVINLDCVHADDMDKLMEKVKLTSIESCPTSADEDEDENYTPLPKDEMLDLIDLSEEAFVEEEKNLVCVKDEQHQGGKGDEYKKTQNINMIPRSSKSLPASSAQSSHNLDETKKDKKKKWNFGNKIWGFFKKHTNKHHGQHASGKPSNIDMKKSAE